MGGSDSKEDNTAHMHGNQLVTVIQNQEKHAQDNDEQFTMLVIIVCLQLVIIIGHVISMTMRCLKKRYTKKGMKTAESILRV